MLSLSVVQMADHDQMAITVRNLQEQLQRMGGIIEAHERRIAELEHVRPRSPRSEIVALGLLSSLYVSGHRVEITTSTSQRGSTNNLLTEDNSEWYSTNAPNSWIQWRIFGGIKVVIDRVKIRGRIGDYGVVNFVVQGSLDGEQWLNVIDSETCAPSYRNWTTEAKSSPETPQLAFPIFRLKQTGICARAPGVAGNDWLVLSYVEYGGKIIYPA
jgi:hypothetical protein